MQALSLLRNQMMAMRKSQSEGLDSSSRMSTSAYSRESFQSEDDDTDIYPETDDDEFYTSKWINQNHVRDG